MHTSRFVSDSPSNSHQHKADQIFCKTELKRQKSKQMFYLYINILPGISGKLGMGGSGEVHHRQSTARPAQEI